MEDKHQIRNKLLFESFKPFIIEVKRLIDKEYKKMLFKLPIVKTKSQELESGLYAIQHNILMREQIGYTVSLIYNKFRTTKQFKDFSQTLLKDNKIIKIRDIRDYRDIFSIVVPFLIYLIKEKNFLNNKLDIEDIYLEFENGIYAEEVRFLYRAFIKNLDGDIKEFSIGDYKFKKLKINELEELSEYDPYDLHPSDAIKDYVQDITFKCERDVICSTANLPVKKQDELYLDTDKLESCFRLLKSGNIEFIRKEIISLNWYSSSYSPLKVIKRLGRDERYNIKEEDIEILNNIFNKLNHTNNHPNIGLAINRFNLIYYKKSEDKIIDLFIALESLFLRDIQQELSYRLSLKIARFLETVPKERKELFDFIKKAYRFRSSIIHGNVNLEKRLKQLKFNSIQQVTKELMQITRKSIVKMLELVQDKSNKELKEYIAYTVLE